MVDWKKRFGSALDQLGDGLKAAGDGLGSAVDDARKAAGFGLGSIAITLGRGQYDLGDCITGTVELELAEPVEAKRLVVALRANRQRLAMEVVNGRRSTVRRNETLHDVECEIGGEQTYVSGEHPFAVHVPTRLESDVDVDGLLGDVVRAAKAVNALGQSPLRWHLEAFLDRPWKRNLSKQIDLSIRMP